MSESAQKAYRFYRTYFYKELGQILPAWEFISEQQRDAWLFVVESMPLDVRPVDVPQPTVEYTKVVNCACVSCAHRGDLSSKPCRRRVDKGLLDAWYCDPCYLNWKNPPLLEDNYEEETDV